MDGGYGKPPDDPKVPGARATGRLDYVQHLYTTTPGSAPPSGLLTVGELGLELATPAKIWVGVPTSMDPTGRRLLLDTANAGGIGEAPEDGQVYGRQGVNHVWLPTLPLSGGTLTGDITIKPASGGAAIHLDSPGPGWPAVTWNAQVAGIAAAYFQSARYGKARWSVEFGGTQAETGGNVGTDFLINRFADDGSVIYPSPFGITRGTGVVSVYTTLMLAGDPTAPLQAVTKQWVEANYSSNAQGDLRWVNVGGDTMTGALGLPVGSATGTSLHFGSLNTGLFGAVNQVLISVTGTARVTVGAASVSFTNVIRTGDGAAAAPAHSFTSEVGSGLYRAGPGTLAMAVGGVATVNWTASALNVGVPLFLAGDPTLGPHAVRLQYLQNNYLTIAQSDARYVNVTGDVMTGGLSFGEFSVTDDYDLTRHVMLFDGGIPHQYGFNVQWGGAIPAHLNYVAGQDAVHQFLIGGTGVIATIRPAGLLMNAGIDFGSAITGTNNTDLSKHISLYNMNHGINVSNRGMNICAGSTFFVNNGVDVAMLTNTTALLNVGLSFGNATTPSSRPTDLTRHLSLFGGGADGSYGFSITNNRLNIVSPVQTYFNNGGNDIGWFDANGLGFLGFYTATLGRLATADMEAVPLKQLSSNLALYVAKSGDTMTGTLHLRPGAFLQMDDTVGNGFRFIMGGDDNLTVTGTNTDGSNRILWDVHMRQDGAPIRHYANIQMVSGAKLFLYDIPTTDSEAANKQYVDGTVTRAGGPFLPLTAGPGMALTGQLYLPHVTPTVAEMATAKFYVDAADQNLQAQISAVVSGNLVFYGQLDVANDVVHYKYTIAIPDSPMPPPTSVPKGGYIIVTTGGIPGTGTNIPPLPPGTPQYVRGDWFISDGEIWIFLPTGLVYFTADAVEVAPPIEGTVNVQDTLQWLHDNKLNIAGGTLTGGLYSPFVPSTGTQVANKAYVDNQITSGSVTSFNTRKGAVVLSPTDVTDATGLLRTGGTMVGELLLASDPTAPLMAATRQYVDAMDPANKYLALTGGTMSGGISFGQGIPASENPTDTSRHITLWEPGLGFSITPYRLNYVVNTLTSHVFLVGGADVLTINSTGIVMNTAYDITLSRPPSLDMHAANKKYIDDKLLDFLPLTGGTMRGNILMSNGYQIQFGNATAAIGVTGQDRSDILGCNVSLSSWHGLGFTTGCPGQVIPRGLFGVAIGTREGYLEAVKVASTDGRLNVPTQIQMLSIYHDGGPNQIIETNVNCYRPSLASIVNGGGSVNVNDRFYDAYGNTYTALVTSGGGVTSLRMDNSRATLYGAPGNPVALTACDGSVAFNVSVNLTWTRPTYLIMQHTYGGLSLYGSSNILLNGGSGGIYAYSPLRPQNGIDFGNAVSGNPQDTSKGITFFGAATGPSYGIVVTGSTLNYNVYDTNNRHDFYAGGTLLFRIWGTDWVRSYLPFSAVNGIQVDGAPGNGAGLVLNQRGGQSQLWGYSNYSARWMIKMASNDEGADATGTTGSAFEVHAYGNDGHYVGQALFIMRAEGRGGDVSFNGYGYIAYDPWQPTSIVNKRWVEANYTTTAAGDARWVNTSGDEITGQLVVTGTTFANGNFIFNFRNDGTSWPVGGYGALGWNVSGGWGEVNFVNACSWAPGGFDWKQVTGNGTWKTLMTMRNDGNLWLSGVGMNYGGLTGSGNLMGFTWASDGSANRVKVWVDGSDQGFLATQSFTDGRYLKLTGGIVTGHTDFTPAISVYGPSAYFWFKPDWEGGWNPIAAVGDNVIFSRKSSGPNIGVLTLTLWNDTALGIRIDGGANTIAMHAANGITITNSLKIANNTGNLNFKDASGGDNFMIMGSDNHFGFYATRANGTQNTIFDFYARSDAPIFQFWLPVTLTTNNTVTLGRDPTANMEAVTRQWVVNNYAPLVGGGYVAKTGDAMSGPLQINWTPTDTAAQLWLRPLGGNDGRSVIRFGATFASPIGDTGPRYVSSIRAGMTGGWVTEYLDIWINNQMNDANSDANQRRIARFTQSRVSIEGDGADPLYLSVPNNNWARVFYTVTGTRTWGAGLDPSGNYVITDEGVPAVRFRIDLNGNAAFYNALNVGAGFYATGGVSGDTIDARNGKFMVASNPDYYFQRHPSTAVWSIVEGTRTVFMVEPNLDHTYGTGTFPGHLKVSNNLSVGNVLTVGNYVAALRLQLNSGDGSGQNAQNQIALSYSNTGQYTHWITTHHFAQSPGRHIDNSIDFWLCDGTGPGVFPTNAYRALSVSSLQITAGVPVVLPADPVGTMEAATRRYVDNKFIPITGGDYVKKSGDTMTGALQVGTGVGYSRVEPGTATNSGHLGFHSPDGTRRGYIGNATAGGVELAVDAGVTLLSLVAPTVWMNGVASLTTGTIYRSFSSNIIGFGWDGTNACVNQYIDGGFQGTIATRGWVGANYKPIGAYTPNQMVDTTSGPTFGSVMNTSGTFYVGGNTNYYLGRNAANGDWLFVENAQWNFQVHSDGQSEARNCGIVGEGGIKFARFGSANSFLFYHDGLGNVRGWVDNNAATDYLVGSWSDRRLKEDIEDSTFDCLDIVNKLPLKQYRWRRQPTPRDGPNVRRDGDDAVVPVGLVAQEVGAVFPSGAYPGLKLEDGDEGLWALNNQSLVAALIGAVQQLTERVKTLEQQRMH